MGAEDLMEVMEVKTPLTAPAEQASTEATLDNQELWDREDLVLVVFKMV